MAAAVNVHWYPYVGERTRRQGFKSLMNILFVCTANACRSIMAEAIARHRAIPGWRAYSVGVSPGGEVDPGSLAILRKHNVGVENLYSKGYDTKPNPDKASFSEPLGGHSARRVGAGMVDSMSSRRNAADGRPAARPQGVPQQTRHGVAALANGGRHYLRAAPCSALAVGL